MLTCCKIYISESRNAFALESIEKAAKLLPETIIVNKFKDDAYNRVGYTLVADSSSSPDTSPIKKSVFSMVKTALEVIDFELHSGSHPRLGVVDHICFHPLNGTSLEHVAHIAVSLAYDVGHNLQVPTYLYGAAHPGGRKLDFVRRELGYFKPNSSGNTWAGSLQSNISYPKPDLGPHEPKKGVIVIGATKWVDNYNVPVESTDVNLVKKISRKVSERGGGLESVQAMGLAHGDELEVACNLLDPSKVGAGLVQAEVERLAKEEGLVVGKGYYTDFSQEKIVEMYANLIQRK